MSLPLYPGPAPDARPPERDAFRVLVAYASKHGSTGEIAAVVAATLVEAGIRADVMPAADVRDLAGYGAVVLGSGLYSATWLRDANRFVRAHRAALAGLPVWLFSSGPLDRSADLDDIPMTTHVTGSIDGLAIRGHRTFGGLLRDDAPEVAAGILSTHRTGDFRDWEAIRRWAREIGAALG